MSRLIIVIWLWILLARRVYSMTLSPAESGIITSNGVKHTRLILNHPLPHILSSIRMEPLLSPSLSSPSPSHLCILPLWEASLTPSSSWWPSPASPLPSHGLVRDYVRASLSTTLHSEPGTAAWHRVGALSTFVERIQCFDSNMTFLRDELLFHAPPRKENAAN